MTCVCAPDNTLNQRVGTVLIMPSFRARDRRRCHHASVKQGAECNTDHQLLLIKLHMSKLYQTAKTTASPHRFDVSKLAGPSSDEDGKNTPRGQFQELATKSATEQWKVDGSIQVLIHSALTEAAMSTLGVEKRRHPDLFRESANSLEPILQKRNQRYQRWLGSGLSSDR